jgi:hypothetical protein
MIFNPLGGIPQLQIASAADLERIGELDRARWAATSVPCDQLFCDPAFLKAMDADHNGRVRVDEVLAARAWLWERLSGRDGVSQRSETLRLADIDVNHVEAKKLRGLAERLLTKLGATSKDAISLAQVRSFADSYAKTFPNGDGSVTASQVSDPDVAAMIADVVAATGGAPDLGGETGARAEDLDAWIERCKALVAWKAQIEGDGKSTILPLGDDTAAAAALVTALAPKVAQFFAQCALLTAETGAEARMQATAEQLAALDIHDPAAIEQWLDRTPLAKVNRDGVIDLESGVNPRFAAQLKQIATSVGPAALGTTGTLTQIDAATWAKITAFVQPWIGWQAARPAGIAEDTAQARLDAAISGPTPAALHALCAEDKGVADELQEFHNLEKLILYQRWLLEFSNNFVSFQQLFSPDERSLFEAGTLVLDGRKLTLCTRVTDPGAHKAIATKSLMFIAYADLTRKNAAGADETAKIAAAVTAGDQGGIDVGKRGVFYDRTQGEWDALITDIVAQPISVWEAMIAPIERMREFVSKRVADFAGSKATALEDAASKQTDAATTLPPVAPPAPKPDAAPAAGGAASNMQGLLIGGSVALAAVGSTLAYVVQTITSISPLNLIGGLGTVVAGLMAVSGFLGWLKLRQRDISTLLEASGWALNGRMKLTFELGSQFTEEPELPAGSVLRLTAEQRRTYMLTGVFVLLLLFIGYWFFTHPELLEMLKPATPPAAPPPAAPPAPPPAG